VHVYLFDWESPAFGGILGACHALELPFVFGVVDVPVVQVFSGGGRAVEVLSDQMQQAWLSFAADGSPGHDGIGDWAAWDPVRRATMIFGARTGLVDAPRDEELSVLERHRPLVSGVPG
jgi:para-nitrobenzyl esterase